MKKGKQEVKTDKQNNLKGEKMDRDFDMAMSIGICAEEYFAICRANKHTPVISCEDIARWEQEERRKEKMIEEMEEDYYAEEPD